MTKETIELRSEEVQEIMGTVPSWIVRWGIATVLAAILIVLLISSFVYYPDVIAGEIMLTTKVPPAKAVVRSSGRIRQIYVHEGQYVKAGDVLAEMENPSAADNIVFLNSLVAGFDAFYENPEQYSADWLDRELIAGEMQQEYNSLRKACKDFQVFLSTAYYTARISNLREQIENYHTLTGIIQKQLALARLELKNSEERYETDKELYAGRVISKMEFKNTEDLWLQKQREYESINRSLADHQVLLMESRKMLLDMEYEYSEQKRGYILTAQHIINNIRNLINQWEQNYLFIAPVSGEVSFLSNWSDNQYVVAGEELFAIVPSGRELSGVVYLSSDGLGKIRQGQKARIQIYDYPHEQYGQLMGSVVSIAPVARENKYKITVALTGGLYTSYNRQLDFKPEMKGSVEIITEQLSILDRIFNKLRKLLKNSLT